VARAGAIAEGAFGDRALYLEKWVERARHVEFQMLADRRGRVMHLYERDCSLQRRHQKVIEEAPAPGIAREALDAVAGSAVAALQALAYDGIGTVETLADAEHAFGFLEVNPRIQVEHAVTEAVTGIDLVAEQIRLAAGGALPARPPLDGHAIEVRIYAEQPRTGAPSTGRLQVFRPPCLHAVRVETGYGEGQFVTPFYDPLLAKVIAHAPSRDLAIGRALVALKAFDVRGVATNIPLLRAALESEAFASGAVHTRFLDEFRWQENRVGDP
jgi:acetyl-CoA carboxylase biotin carboxylase subunit